MEEKNLRFDTKAKLEDYRHFRLIGMTRYQAAMAAGFPRSVSMRQKRIKAIEEEFADMIAIAGLPKKELIKICVERFKTGDEKVQVKYLEILTELAGWKYPTPAVTQNFYNWTQILQKLEQKPSAEFNRQPSTSNP